MGLASGERFLRIDFHYGTARTARIELALTVAGEFGLTLDEAKDFAVNMAGAVQLGASRGEIEFMRSAFQGAT